jgi:hypothetical protein
VELIQALNGTTGEQCTGKDRKGTGSGLISGTRPAVSGEIERNTILFGQTVSGTSTKYRQLQ